jgi:serine/threonine protein kinase
MLHFFQRGFASHAWFLFLQPSNVLLNADCRVKICDFGLARSVKDVEDAKSSTLS